MEQLVRTLCDQRQQLSRLILEVTAAVNEHHDAWQPHLDDLLDTLPWHGPDDPRRALELNRRLEGYYLGQAVALSWMIQWLDTTLQHYAAPAAGRVFSCPVPWAADTTRAERAKQIPVSFLSEPTSEQMQAGPSDAAN
jgi:hypothetical protein